MNKIARLRQEIERLKKYYAECGYPGMGEYEQGNKQVRLDTLDYFLSFLDTLSEEPDKSLEEAAEKWCKENGRGFVLRDKSAYYIGETLPAFKAGSEWQKSQMLKDAYAESQIVEDGRIELGGNPLPCLNPIILLPYPQFEPGDKVRIVVLKEEEE